MSLVYGDGVINRVNAQPSIDECLDTVGAAIEVGATVHITAFCWANGLDVALVMFDVEDYAKE